MTQQIEMLSPAKKKRRDNGRRDRIKAIARKARSLLLDRPHNSKELMSELRINQSDLSYLIRYLSDRKEIEFYGKAKNSIGRNAVHVYTASTSYLKKSDTWREKNAKKALNKAIAEGQLAECKRPSMLRRFAAWLTGAKAAAA